MRHRSLGATLTAVLLLSATACGGGVKDGGTTGPDTTGTVPPPPPPGTVQRASITVQVGIDPADAAIAASAGVNVSGVTVRLQRTGSTEAPKVATTDANGSARFEELLEGVYTASADRVLTAAEIARLPIADRDASVFAGGVQVMLAPPAPQTVTLAMVGARRGSLVVSELNMFIQQSGPIYQFGHYVEVYNNADTTIYLDGIEMFRTTPFMHTDSWGDCSVYTAKRENPERLWVNRIMRFPGSGREYPILPGEAKVVAMDALNHTTASGREEFPDLSRAHFEQMGNEADPDNPAAANMIRGFNAPISSTLGHGAQNTGLVSYGLALPGAEMVALVDTLVESRPDGSPNFPGKNPIAGIPAAYVLDVFSMDLHPTRRAFLRSINFGSEACPQWLAPNFERRPAELWWDAMPDAIRRKSLGISSAGREILQRTKTSSRDLEYGPKLRRSLNKP